MKWSTDRRYAAPGSLSPVRPGVLARLGGRHGALAIGWARCAVVAGPSTRRVVWMTMPAEPPPQPPPPSGPPPRPRSPLSRLREVWHDWRADPLDRFGVVLFFVIATIVVNSLVNIDSSYGDSLLAHTMSGLALVTAARAVGMHPRGRRVVTVVVVVAVGGLALLSLGEAVLGRSGLVLVEPQEADPLWVLLVIVVPVIVIRRIAQHTVVSSRTVLGAVTAYLQIGVAYAAVFQAVYIWSPEPAFGTPQVSSAFTYLSLTTISTLGIGDVVPTTEVSRLLVSSEAVLGQVFLVTVVAMVVSQFAGGRRATRVTDETP